MQPTPSQRLRPMFEVNSRSGRNHSFLPAREQKKQKKSFLFVRETKFKLKPATKQNLNVMERLPQLMNDMEQHLSANKALLFGKQHRNKKRSFLSFKGSFAVGTGVVQPGFKQNIGKKPGFCLHNFKNTGVYNLPIYEQFAKWSGSQKHKVAKLVAYCIAMDIVSIIDPDFAAGEYVVQFAYMNGGGYVDWHKDSDDISYQYDLCLGDFSGAYLRAYKNDHKKSQKATQPYREFDIKNKILKFDGRLPHEVVTDDFQGERFTVIFYKTYDHRKTRPDPVFQVPEIVYG